MSNITGRPHDLHLRFDFDGDGGSQEYLIDRDQDGSGFDVYRDGGKRGQTDKKVSFTRADRLSSFSDENNAIGDLIVKGGKHNGKKLSAALLEPSFNLATGVTLQTADGTAVQVRELTADEQTKVENAAGVAKRDGGLAVDALRTADFSRARRARGEQEKPAPTRRLASPAAERSGTEPPSAPQRGGPRPSEESTQPETQPVEVRPRTTRTNPPPRARSGVEARAKSPDPTGPQKAPRGFQPQYAQFVISGQPHVVLRYRAENGDLEWVLAVDNDDGRVDLRQGSADTTAEAVRQLSAATVLPSRGNEVPLLKALDDPNFALDGAILALGRRNAAIRPLSAETIAIIEDPSRDGTISNHNLDRTYYGQPIEVRYDPAPGRIAYTVTHEDQTFPAGTIEAVREAINGIDDADDESDYTHALIDWYTSDPQGKRDLREAFRLYPKLINTLHDEADWAHRDQLAEFIVPMVDDPEVMADWIDTMDDGGFINWMTWLFSWLFDVRSGTDPEERRTNAIAQAYQEGDDTLRTMLDDLAGEGGRTGEYIEAGRALYESRKADGEAVAPRSPLQEATRRYNSNILGVRKRALTHAVDAATTAATGRTGADAAAIQAVRSGGVEGLVAAQATPSQIQILTDAKIVTPAVGHDAITRMAGELRMRGLTDDERYAALDAAAQQQPVQDTPSAGREGEAAAAPTAAAKATAASQPTNAHTIAELAAMKPEERPQHLNLTGKVADRDLVRLLTQLYVGDAPTLATLHIPNASDITGTGVAILANQPGLVDLAIENGNIGGKDTQALANSRGIQRLAVRNSGLEANDALALLENINLVALDLSDNDLTDRVAIAAARRTNLVRLNLSGNQLTTRGGDALAAMRSFTHLDVSGNKIDRSTQRALEAAGRAEGKTVVVGRQDVPAPNTIASLREILKSEAFSELPQHLVLTDAGLNDRDAVLIATLYGSDGAPELKSLRIEQGGTISDNGIRVLAGIRHRKPGGRTYSTDSLLGSLIINGEHKITHKGLAPLVALEEAGSLTQVNIGYTNASGNSTRYPGRVTTGPTGTGTPSRGARGSTSRPTEPRTTPPPGSSILQELIVGKTDGELPSSIRIAESDFTGAQLTWLLRQYQSDDAPLLRLVFSDINLTDEMVRTLGNSTKVSSVYLDGVHIGDEGVQTLVSNPNSALTSLDLRSAGVTDAGVQAISNRFKDEDSFVALGLGDNGGVTDASYAAIAALGSLTYLNLRGTRMTAAKTDQLTRPGRTLLVARPLQRPARGDRPHASDAYNGLLADIAKKGKLLSSFSVTDEPGFNDANIKQVLAYYKQNGQTLSKIFLEDTQVTDAGIAAFVQAGVTTVHLVDNARLTAKSARALAGGASVTDVAIVGSNVGDSAAEVLANNTKITAIELSNAGITDQGATHLAGKEHVTTLMLSNNARITDKTAATLTDRHNVTLLNLSGTQITSKGAAHIANMRGLERVWVDDCCIGGKGLNTLRAREGVSVAHADQRQPAAEIQAFLDEAKKALTPTLTVHEPGFNDEHLADLVAAYKTRAKMLTGIRLAGTSVSDKGVITLIKGTASLRAIEFDPSHIVSPVLEAVRNSSIEQVLMFGDSVGDGTANRLASVASMRALTLVDSDVTDDGFAGLGSNNALETLVLVRSGITNDGVRRFSETGTKITHLNLAGSNIDDGAIPHLKRMTKLTHLDVSGCNFSPAGLARLVREGLTLVPTPTAATPATAPAGAPAEPASRPAAAPTASTPAGDAATRLATALNDPAQVSVAITQFKAATTSEKLAATWALKDLSSTGDYATLPTIAKEMPILAEQVFRAAVERDIKLDRREARTNVAAAVHALLSANVRMYDLVATDLMLPSSERLGRMDPTQARRTLDVALKEALAL